MNQKIHVVRGNEVTQKEEGFINLWSQEYFGEVAVSRGLKKAPVHWRIFLSDGGKLVSHVALTEFTIEVNGCTQVAGAVGGLFTDKKIMGQGYGNKLMDYAEQYIFEQLDLKMGILFCLSSLVPFYSSRQWDLVDSPVTLAQKTKNVTWGESVMTLSREAVASDMSIHVPRQ